MGRGERGRSPRLPFANLLLTCHSLGTLCRTPTLHSSKLANLTHSYQTTSRAHLSSPSCPHLNA